MDLDINWLKSEIKKANLNPSFHLFLPTDQQAAIMISTPFLRKMTQI